MGKGIDILFNIAVVILSVIGLTCLIVLLASKINDVSFSEQFNAWLNVLLHK